MTIKSIVIGRGDPELIARIEAERKRRGHATASKTVRALVDERLAQMEREIVAEDHGAVEAPNIGEPDVAMPWST